MRPTVKKLWCIALAVLSVVSIPVVGDVTAAEAPRVEFADVKLATAFLSYAVADAKFANAST
eukprot:5572225-Ditylum_brightwellii.AAC.1